MKIAMLALAAMAVVLGGLWLVAPQAKESAVVPISIDINKITKKAGDLPVTQVDSYM